MTSEIDGKRVKHRWLYKLMLFGLLTPMLSVSGLTAAETLAPSSSNVTVTIHAKPKGKKHNDGGNKGGGNGKDNKNSGSGSESGSSSEESSSTSSSSGQSANESPWDQALDSLGDSAAKDSDITNGGSDSTDDSDKDKNKDKTGDDAENEQADFKDITGWMSVWGFLGISNQTFWQNSNNSSASTSFDAMDQFPAKLSNYQGSNAGDVKHYMDAYQQAGTYAYVMHTIGLDQSFKSGFKKVSILYAASGTIEQIAYVVLANANKLFNGALQILSAMNPIAWARYGANASPQFAPLANVINKLYQATTGIGWAIMGIILAASLALAGMGVSVGTGQPHVGGARAILNTFVNLLKRLFVWMILPVFCMYFFDATVQYAKGAFENQSNSVSDYAVFGSMVDYHDWVMNSRLDLPAGVTLSSSLSDKEIKPLTHSDILKINQIGAGYTGLQGLASATDGKGSVDEINGSNQDPKLDAEGKALLTAWKSGDSIQASDYASAVSPDVRNNAAGEANKDKSGDSKKNKSAGSDSGPNGGSTDSALAQELTKRKYNDNSNLQNGGDMSKPFFGGGATNGGGVLSSTDNGGLSTLGMYAYLETSGDSNELSIVRPTQLSNETAQPRHRSVVLVGQGIEQSGNLVWSFGLAVGLAFLVLGYLLETLKTIIESIMGMTAGVLETALASIRGGVKLISVCAALMIGVFGSAIMYLVATKAFIAVGSMSDTLLRNDVTSSVVNWLTLNTGSSNVAMLASGVNNAVVNGAVNWFEGLFLLWVAWLLLHYRGVVVASLASLVEETANKIMATFGSLTGQGSSGTRGMIMSNSNVSNSVGNMMGGLGRSAGQVAMLGAAGGGLKSLASKMGNQKSDKKGADQKHNNDKNNNRASQYGSRSSSNKRGFAAEKTANNSLMNTSAQRNNNRNSNAASTVARNNEQNGLRESANEGAGLGAQNGFQNLAYSPNAGRSSNMSNSAAMTGLNSNDASNAAMNNASSIGGIGGDQSMNGQNNAAMMNADSSIGATNGDRLNGDQVNGDNLANGMNNSDMANDSALNADAMNDNGLNDYAGDQMAGDQMSNDLDNSMDNGLDNGLDNATNPNDMITNDAGQTMTAEQDQAMQQDALANQLYGGDNSTMNAGGNRNVMGNQNAQNHQNSRNHSNQHAGNASGTMRLGAASRGASIATNAANTGVIGNTANSLQAVPVNGNATAASVQSKMGDVHQAQGMANRANNLAAANPANKTLQLQAHNAQQNLASLQNGAMKDYNSQAITGNMPQNSWLSAGADRSNMSVGTANNAMNHVYSAQEKLSQVSDRYGASSPQAAQAQQQLKQARADAVHSGLDSSVVNDSKAVTAAHAQISENASRIMNGTWSPQNNGGVAHLDTGSSRTIGI